MQLSRREYDERCRPSGSSFVPLRRERLSLCCTVRMLHVLDGSVKCVCGLLLFFPGIHSQVARFFLTLILPPNWSRTIPEGGNNTRVPVPRDQAVLWETRVSVHPDQPVTLMPHLLSSVRCHQRTRKGVRPCNASNSAKSRMVPRTVVSLFLFLPGAEPRRRGESHGLGIHRRRTSEVEGKSCGGSKRSRPLGFGCLAQGAWHCNVTSCRDPDTKRGD